MSSQSQNASGDFGIRDHIIICNWSSKADVMVRQLHDPSVKNKRPIIVVTNFPEDLPKSTDPIYRGLLIIGGEPADKETLIRAGIAHANTVIVLADEKDPENSDSKSIMTVLAIEAVNPHIHIIVELVKSNSEMFFQYTHVDEIVCLEQLAEKLLAQSALTPGLSLVYMDLLTQSADTNEIYQEHVPDEFIGMAYREAEEKIISIDEKDIILIGFSTTAEKTVDGVSVTNGWGNKIFSKKIVINPKSSSKDTYSKDYIFQANDTIFLISYEQPNIAEYFAGKN